MSNMYVCEICKKEFKTTQHLNQHKNRKKSCVNNCHNNVLNSPNSVDKMGLDGINVEPKLNCVDVIKFIKTYNNIVEFVEESKKLLAYKNEIIELKKENDKLNKQLLSIQKVIKPKNVTVKKRSILKLEVSPLTDNNEYESNDYINIVDNSSGNDDDTTC